MRLRSSHLIERWPAVAGGVALVVAASVLTLGPGTDLDTGAVIRSGRTIMDGDYVASRAPGAPVHEAAVGVLEAVGGTVLANLGSLVMAVVLVVGLVVLLRGEGVPHAELAAAFVVANPWFQVAATSTVDFVWAMGFAVLGFVALRRDRPIVAGVLFGLGVGCRMTTSVVVASALGAQLLDRGDQRSERRLTVWVAGAVTAIVGIVAFVPPFFAAGSSLAFANNDFATSTPLNHLGRALAKDFYFFGPYAALGLLLTVPAVARTVVRFWHESWALRCAVIGLVATQLLFLRFPWKMGHLVPTLVFVAMLLAVAFARRPAWLAALVAAQLAFGLVNVELFRPDTPNEAHGATFGIEVRWGPFIVDTQCRAEDQGAWVDNDGARVEAVWNCAKPWGDGP